MHVSGCLCTIITQLHYKPRRPHLSLPPLIFDKLRQTVSSSFEYKSTEVSSRCCKKGGFHNGAQTAVPRLLSLFFRPLLHPSFSRGVTSERFPVPGRGRGQTEAAVFSWCLLAISDTLGPAWGRVQLQTTQSTACFWWLFIQSECPTNGLPHVTRTSQTRTAAATCLWKYWCTTYSQMCTQPTIIS